MPYLYNGFCYPDISIPAQKDASTPIQAFDGFVAYSVGYTLLGSDTVNHFYRIHDLQAGTNVDYTVQRTYQTCVDVGPMTNTSGLTVMDAVELAFMVGLVWVVAWAFKQFSRGFFL